MTHDRGSMTIKVKVTSAIRPRRLIQVVDIDKIYIPKVLKLKSFYSGTEEYLLEKTTGLIYPLEIQVDHSLQPIGRVDLSLQSCIEWFFRFEDELG